MITEVIILCGGRGRRLTSVTKNKIPKPLVKIQDKSILEWQLEYLRKYGVKRAVLATGYLSDLIQTSLGDSLQTKYGEIEIDYSIEKKKLGSGGAVKKAGNLISSKDIIVMNGDILTNADLSPLIKTHESLEIAVTMLLVNMTSPYGIAKVHNHYVIDFLEKPKLDIPIHAGIDIISTDKIQEFPDNGQMEETIFIELAKKRQLGYYLISDNEYWISIETEKDYNKANEEWN